MMIRKLNHKWCKVFVWSHTLVMITFIMLKNFWNWDNERWFKFFFFISSMWHDDADDFALFKGVSGSRKLRLRILWYEIWRIDSSSFIHACIVYLKYLISCCHDFIPMYLHCPFFCVMKHENISALIVESVCVENI